MVFSSIEFLFVFLPAFLALYYLDGRLANPVLLAFSLVFYAAGEGWYLLLMLASIALNWAAGRAIAAASGRARRLRLAAGVAANLALLAYWKYWGFLLAQVLGRPDAVPEGGIHLPLGISFFTFQAISYLVDVARGDCPAERSALRLGAYIAMFPQLVAGPIVRFASVAQALHARSVTPADLYHGLGFFALGLVAKTWIADGAAPVADAVFGADPGALRADAAWLGLAAYTLQIYFDFLGYSAMAIGLGLLLGFRFPQNFDHPYVSRSITEFWRRWHISLSSWFRDYVYIPLGGNRRGAARTWANLWIVFLLTGIWHGAAWTFVLWGLWHGAFLVAERAGGARLLARLPAPVAMLYALLAAMGGWVLFRAEDIAHAGAYYAALVRVEAPLTAAAWWSAEAGLTLAAGAALSGPWAGRLAGRVVALPAYLPQAARLRPGPVAAGLALFALLFAAGAVRVLSGSYSPFIYFRF